MKKHALLSPMLLLLLLSAGHSQTAQFSGSVLNGSLDSTAVTDQPVMLQLFRIAGHAPVEVASTRSAANGRFEFSITSPDTGGNYLASTEHQGIRYYSDPVHFAHESQMNSDIVIFDSTQSTQGVVALMHHLFMQDAGEVLAVKETRILNNPTAKTIINAVNDEHQTGAIFRLDLPPWAQNISPIASQFGSDLVVHQHRVYDVGVFEPGNRQISFVYESPWQQDRTTLVLQVYQPTRSLDLFVAEQGLAVEGAGLTDYGPFNIRGTNYHRYGLDNAMPGARIQIQVKRQPPDADAFPPMLTLLATAALLLLGLSLANRYKPGTKQGLDAEQRNRLQSERKDLIQAIARLEVEPDYASNPQMQQQRADWFNRLERIEHKLQQNSQGAKSGKK